MTRTWTSAKAQEFTTDFTAWASERGLTADEISDLISQAGYIDELRNRRELAQAYELAEATISTRRAARGPAATDRQIDYLLSLGASLASVEDITKAEASQMIDDLKARKATGGRRARQVGRSLGIRGEIWDF